MKIFKKSKLLLFGLLINGLLINNINADTGTQKEICEPYTNYYFLSTILTAETHEKAITGNGWITTFHNTIPNLTIEEELNVNTKKTPTTTISTVCLVRDINDKSPCANLPSNTEVMTLNDYYTKYLQASKNGNKVTYTNIYSTKENKETYSYIYVDNNNKNTRFITHSNWAEISENGTIIEHENGADLKEISAADMTKAAALPNRVSINFTDSQGPTNIINNPTQITVGRTVTSDFNSNLTPFKMVWPKTTENDIILSPALYKIEYEVCETKTVYTAIIDYIYADTKEPIPTLDRYYKTDLVSGDGEDVPSPEVDGCTRNKPTVNYKITNDNFVTTVEYTCETSPGTGSSFVVVIVVIAAISLGCIIYFIHRNKKKNK